MKYDNVGTENLPEVQNLPKKYNRFLIAEQDGTPLVLSQKGDTLVGNIAATVIDPSVLRPGDISSEFNQTNFVIYSGKLSFTDTTAGYRLGIDTDGKVKFYVGSGSANYLLWDGTTLTVKGGLTVSKLDIPDTTTANSMHVDTSGNTWWGANVAQGLANANASVTSAGAAVFKSIQVGGTTNLYTMNNSGIFSFGDGSDGAATFDGVGAVAGATLAGSTYTLTRDVFYTNATVSTGVTIKPNGYRMFGTGTLTLNGTAVIQGNGNAGGAGGAGQNGQSTGGGNGGTAGTAGAALADGYLKGSLAGASGVVGGNGGNGGAGGQNGTIGNGGVNTSNSLGNNGSAGGAGGDGAASVGAKGTGGGMGSIGTATASLTKLKANWQLQPLLDITATGATIKFDNSASGSGGGGGGGGGGGTGGNGGGGGGGSGGTGSGGGIIAIYFRNIVLNTGTSITANGGNGGVGGQGGGTNPSVDGGNGGGGAGGAGGNGGIIVLVYNTLTNNGTITVTGGTGGAGGAAGTSGVGTAAAGTAGNNGSAGTLYQFSISL